MSIEKIQDILEKDEGEFLLTPKYSMLNKVHIKDIVRFLEEKQKKSETELLVQMYPVKNGAMFKWGPYEERE